MEKVSQLVLCSLDRHILEEQPGREEIYSAVQESAKAIEKFVQKLGEFFDQKRDLNMPVVTGRSRQAKQDAGQSAVLHDLIGSCVRSVEEAARNDVIKNDKDNKRQSHSAYNAQHCGAFIQDLV